ncbi:MAG: hypothetical protein WD207_07640 [Xanthobacteraceae bacterium]
MSSANPLLAYWWFHLPNLALAALMYTALGRFVLTFVFDPESKNYIWRFFVRITDPVVNLVSYVTPRAVPPLVVLLFSVVWLFSARAALLLAVTMAGLAPTTGVPAQ